MTTNNIDILDVAKGAVHEYFRPLFNLSKPMASESQPVDTLILSQIDELKGMICSLKEELSCEVDEQGANFSSLQAEVKKLVNLQLEATGVANAGSDNLLGLEVLKGSPDLKDDNLHGSISDYINVGFEHTWPNIKQYGPFNFELYSKVLSGNFCSSMAAGLGLSNIEYLIKSIRKTVNKGSPYLFGLNKGGALLANTLAHRLHLHEKYLVKCDINLKLNRVFCEDREITNKLIFIIDDVTRSGNTIKKAKQHLSNIYPKAKIFTFVLVANASEADWISKENLGLVDYSPWVSFHKKIKLPWSETTDEDVEISDFFDDTSLDQITKSIGHSIPKIVGEGR